MKKILQLVFIINSLCILKAWCVTPHDQVSLLFPVQPSLVYTPSSISINPFKMRSYSYGGGVWQVPLSNRELFIPYSWHDGLLNSFNRSNEFKIESPYDQDKISLGVDILSTEYIFKGSKLYDRNVLITFKNKLPFNTAIGRFAFTLTPKAGMMRFNLIDDDLQGFGITGGVGLGFDYYWSQWFGCYLEYTIRYNYLRFFISEKKHEPYHYSLKNLVFGFKTTL